MKTILIGLDPDALSSTQHSRVQALAPDARIVITSDRSQIVALLDSVEVAVGDVPVDLILSAPNLRWFQQWGAGADWLLRYPQAVEQDWILTNVSGIHAIPISEHICALMLAFARRLPESIRAQDHRQWLRHVQQQVFELARKTALIVGLGPIGERTAQLAIGLGIRVFGVRRDPTVGKPGFERIVGLDHMHQLLPEADFVLMTLPLTRDTKGIFSAREFQLMKPTAYFINIGRGGTVKEEDLINALRENQIAGAGLDVFETEPLPENSPLWDMENVIITAHYAGSNPHYIERAMAIFIDNLARYQTGEPLRKVVDKERGY